MILNSFKEGESYIVLGEHILANISVFGCLAGIMGMLVNFGSLRQLSIGKNFKIRKMRPRSLDEVFWLKMRQRYINILGL